MLHEQKLHLHLHLHLELQQEFHHAVSEVASNAYLFDDFGRRNYSDGIHYVHSESESGREKSGREKSGREKSGCEKSGREKSGREKKSGRERGWCGNRAVCDERCYSTFLL